MQWKVGVVVLLAVMVLLVRVAAVGSESQHWLRVAVVEEAATARQCRSVFSSANTVACASHCGSTHSCAWWTARAGTVSSSPPPSSRVTEPARPVVVAWAQAFAAGRHCCLP
jgi:hypothetical protein